jgi:histidine triad (HIT) family protein
MADCIFCRIVRKELPADMMYEGTAVVAFRDIHPQAPVHTLIVPKKHIAKVMDLSSEDQALLAEIHSAAQDVARKEGVQTSGFRLVVNNGANAGQAVDHLHYHLLAGRKLGWPPG